MTRVVVHAGFHKTGTSSLQAYLARHRAALKPWFDYYGQTDFNRAGAQARIYAQRRFAWRLHGFRRAFRAFLATIPDAEVIVLSRENFSGNMPGHRDWAGRSLKDFRSAAVPLLRVVKAELARRFGPDVQIDLLFTTRDRDTWQRSVYGHLLRSIHLAESFDEFRERLPALPDLEAEAIRIGQAVALPTHTRKLESLASSRPGPARAVLDLAAVPNAVWQTLPPAEYHNPGQSPALEAEFLRLNRSGKPKADLKRIKDRMIAEERA